MKITDCSTYKKVTPASGRSLTAWQEGSDILEFSMCTEACVPHSMTDEQIKATWRELTSTKALTLKSQCEQAWSEKRVEDLKTVLLDALDKAVTETKIEKMKSVRDGVMNGVNNRMQSSNPLIEMSDMGNILARVKELI